MKICYNCGDKLLDAAKRCPHCGAKDGKKGNVFYSVDKSNIDKIEKIVASVPHPKSGVSKWQTNLEYRELAQTLSTKDIMKAAAKHKVSQIAQMEKDGTAYCPKCYSTSLSSDKKGFGIGKAVVGAAITNNPIGLIAGNIGAKKVRITCLKCGYQFWAGKK